MKAILTLEFNPETYELHINAPDLELDFVLSLIDRAQRELEEQVRIRTARTISMYVRTDINQVKRTEEVLNRVMVK